MRVFVCSFLLVFQSHLHCYPLSPTLSISSLAHRSGFSFCPGSRTIHLFLDLTTFPWCLCLPFSSSFACRHLYVLTKLLACVRLCWQAVPHFRWRCYPQTKMMTLVTETGQDASPPTSTSSSSSIPTSSSSSSSDSTSSISTSTVGSTLVSPSTSSLQTSGTTVPTVQCFAHFLICC